MTKRLRVVVLIVVIAAVASCSAPLGEPVSVKRDRTVSFDGGDLKIRNCYYMREYLVPDEENEHGSEEWYDVLEITVDGRDRTIERSVGAGAITFDGYQITVVEMEPEPEVKCIVVVERSE